MSAGAISGRRLRICDPALSSSPPAWGSLRMLVVRRPRKNAVARGPPSAFAALRGTRPDPPPGLAKSVNSRFESTESTHSVFAMYFRSVSDRGRCRISYTPLCPQSSSCAPTSCPVRNTIQFLLTTDWADDSCCATPSASWAASCAAPPALTIRLFPSLRHPPHSRRRSTRHLLHWTFPSVCIRSICCA